MMRDTLYMTLIFGLQREGGRAEWQRRWEKVLDVAKTYQGSVLTVRWFGTSVYYLDIVYKWQQDL